MKVMKKIYLILGFVIMTMIAFGQVAPVANMRVATATTPLGINIPVGYLVYDYGADKLYNCKTASVGTLTLTTGAANFEEISLGANHAPVTIVTLTAHGLHLTGQAITMDTATVSQTGTLRGTDFTTFNNKVTSITAGVGINIAGTTTVPIAKVDTADASILSRQRAVHEYLGLNATAANSSLLESHNAAYFATAASVKTAFVEDLEVATADSSSGHFYIIPAHTPISTTLSVVFNNMPLVPTTQYTIVSNKVRIGFSPGLYDKIQLKYAY
jgi:hypothetical protein